ncbi:Cadmium, cobalt and zinc/H(+)-K(+) antiporter [bioreactor metagenome]|uniref:Cadmium, cobalt and zinc/H(+)-K(+) antiporter n=1 Tax=bioreactor metagenome TaxID=1076179 RepID=A0A645I1D9_9ZZZZ
MGLIINVVGAILLQEESKKNLNIKGAFLHIIGDLLGSIGTILAGAIILIWKFYLADPIISIIIALLILYSSINLIKESVNVLMESSPSHIKVDEIKKTLLEISDIIDIHDLHVWSISSEKIALSAHIVANTKDNKTILFEINSVLKEKFDIGNSTIQIEPEDYGQNECMPDFDKF